MKSNSSIEKQLKDLDKRMQKAISESLRGVTSARNISLNQEKEKPSDTTPGNKIYLERVHIFECLEKGEDLPDVISDLCLIQCILMLELLMSTTIQNILEKFPLEPKVKYVVNNDREEKKMREKLDIKLLKEATPYVEQMEYMKECIIWFHQKYTEDYPELYIRYNNNIN